MNKIKILELDDFGVPSKIKLTYTENDVFFVYNKSNSTYYYEDKKYNSYPEWISLNGNIYV